MKRLRYVKNKTPQTTLIIFLIEYKIYGSKLLLDKGNDVIYVDFQHLQSDILTCKINSIGFSRNPVTKTEIWLMNHNQSLMIEWHCVRVSVSQISLLNSILLNIFINELVKVATAPLLYLQMRLDWEMLWT